MIETASQYDLRDVAGDVLRRSEALALDQVEVVVTRNRKIEVTIEKNGIHMTRHHDEPAVGVRVIHGGSVGFASANAFHPSSLSEALHDAASIARVCVGVTVRLRQTQEVWCLFGVSKGLRGFERG